MDKLNLNLNLAETLLVNSCIKRVALGFEADPYKTSLYLDEDNPAVVNALVQNGFLVSLNDRRGCTQVCLPTAAHVASFNRCRKWSDDVLVPVKYQCGFGTIGGALEASHNAMVATLIETCLPPTTDEE